VCGYRSRACVCVFESHRICSSFAEKWPLSSTRTPRMSHSCTARRGRVGQVSLCVCVRERECMRVDDVFLFLSTTHYTPPPYYTTTTPYYTTTTPYYTTTTPYYYPPGLAICVLLLYCNEWQLAEEALSYYAVCRTVNQKGRKSACVCVCVCCCIGLRP
jgi:hypothetical protein